MITKDIVTEFSVPLMNLIRKSASAITGQCLCSFER